MGGKNRIHKNRIFLTLFIMTFLMFAVAAISAFYLANTAVNTIIRDCRASDLTAEKLAVMIEQEIIQKKRMLNCYAEILENSQKWTDADFLQKFLEFEDNGDFIGFALLRMEGDVVTDMQGTIDPDAVRLAQMAMIDENGNSLRDIYVGIGQDNNIFYAVPLIFNNYSKGIFAGIVPAGIDGSGYGEDTENGAGEIYILNSGNQVVGYAGSKGRDFQYEDIRISNMDNLDENSREHFLSIAEGLAEAADDPSFIEWDETEEKAGGNSFFNHKGIKLLSAGGRYIWYERPVKAGEEMWKLVLGKELSISGESLMLIASGAILVAFIIIFFFILMVIIVALQGVSNYRLEKLAYTDFITGYDNWTRFQLEVEKMLQKKKKTAGYAMISLDIRKFRVITDIDGERKGEIILKGAADVLKKQIGRKEFFARFSIDEFGMLLACENEEAAADRMKQMDVELKKGVTEAAVNYIYGIYFITDDKMPVQKMYNYAAMARDHIKAIPDKTVGIFNSSMRENLVKEKTLENHMEAAIRNKEFHVYLQPKYKADGSSIGGAEALVRWISPELGFISPGEFISLFEKNGFILKLDDYMLDSVCAFQKKWMEMGKELVTISVNMSRAHLVEPGLVEKITNQVDFYGIPHSCIELELTESAFFDDKQVLLNTVIGLREQGFFVSMDDFGSGYSSLNSLKDLPLDVVKLDGEFFNKTGDWVRSETVIKDTISLAKHLKMKIVAEGIETQEQVTFLNEIGCDLIQGYYFAKPMPVNDFEKLMGY